MIRTRNCEFCRLPSYRLTNSPLAPEVGFKPTTYRLEGGYCCSLSYSGIWWDPWDSNPDNTGYEPGARTICTKVPYWRRTEVSIPMPLSEHSQFSRLVCGPPQFIRQIIGALDRTRTYNIYHLKVARLPNCATRAFWCTLRESNPRPRN